MQSQSLSRKVQENQLPQTEFQTVFETLKQNQQSAIQTRFSLEFQKNDYSLDLKFEKGNTESQTFYDNLPDHFLSKMMPAIVGFEIKADKLENVFKLSQNRDEKSYVNIISKLTEQGGYSEMIAKEMIKRKSELFPEGVEWDGSRFDS